MKNTLLIIFIFIFTIQCAEPLPYALCSMSETLRPMATKNEKGIKDVDAVISKLPVPIMKKRLHVDIETKFSTDFKTAITTRRGGARIWDVKTNKTIAKLKGHSKNKYNTIQTALSPDGKKAVTADSHGVVIVWDIVKASPIIKVKGHKHRIESVGFSWDSRRVITRGHSVKIWDIPSGRHWTIKLEAEINSICDAAALSPHGNRAIIGYADGTARIYDVKTGKRLLILKVYEEDVFVVAFSHDGKKVMTGCHTGGIVKIWDAKTGKCLFDLTGKNDSAIRSAAFSPDDTMVATAPWNDKVRIWDIRTGKNLACMTEHSDAIYYLGFSPDNKKLVSVSDDDTAIIWDISGLAAARGEYSLFSSAGEDEESNKFNMDRKDKSPDVFIKLLKGYFEKHRSTPIDKKFKGHAWSGTFATWSNGTRNTIKELHDKITVYYPGAGSDILYPLLATDGDVFVFVDLSSRILLKKLKLITSIKLMGGDILTQRRTKSGEYYLEFFIWGKRRELYYYTGINAADQKSLPERVKNGYNVYIERKVSAGYGVTDGNNICPLALSYLKNKGFAITDFILANKYPFMYQIGYTGSHLGDPRFTFNVKLEENNFNPHDENVADRRTAVPRLEVNLGSILKAISTAA